MATFTTRLSLRKPATTDVVNVTTDISDNMNKLDAAVGAHVGGSYPVTPYAGQLALRTDLNNTLWVYTGSTWLELQRKGTIPQPQTVVDVTVVNTSSTSYVNLNPTVAITFTAPDTGKVYVTVTGALEAESPAAAVMACEIRENNASGAVVSSAQDRDALRSQDLFFTGASARSLVTGLTEGNTYYARILCRTTSNQQSTFFARGLLIEPVLGA